MALTVDAFNAELRLFREVLAPAEVAAFTGLVALDLFTRLVFLTPVDTGRARGGWQLNVTRAPGTEKGSLDTEGQSTIAAAHQKVATLKPFSQVYISNPVFYIVYLDQGTDKMAPLHITDKALAETKEQFIDPNLNRVLTEGGGD